MNNLKVSLIPDGWMVTDSDRVDSTDMMESYCTEMIDTMKNDSLAHLGPARAANSAYIVEGETSFFFRLWEVWKKREEEEVCVFLLKFTSVSSQVCELLSPAHSDSHAFQHASSACHRPEIHSEALTLTVVKPPDAVLTWRVATACSCVHRGVKERPYLFHAVYVSVLMHTRRYL